MRHKLLICIMTLLLSTQFTNALTENDLWHVEINQLQQYNLEDYYNFNAKIHFNPHNLRELSNMTPSMAEDLLRGKLKGLGVYFIEAEEKYQVNATFMIACSRLESANGSYRFMTRNNLFSLGCYDGNVDNGFSFKTKEDCINYFAELIDEEYLVIDGKYHNGISIWSVNKMYASDRTWSDQIIDIIGIEEE